MSETAIKVSGLKKSYRYYKSNMQKIQNLLFGIDAGEKTEVLKGVSFEIKKGERVGIISTPMSGRSTLMQILAGVLEPDSGTVELNGRLTAILDHKLGFEGAMSGRVNYEVRCRLMGWTGEMIKEHAESVFERADIADVIDEPMKIYRRGSANRLGFAIATEFTPEIMLYDETFSFGGKKYISKSVSRLNKITKGEDTTFLIIINDLKRGAKLCERGIVLHKGKVVFDGSYEEAALYYNENLKPAVKKDEEGDPGANKSADESRGSGAAEAAAERDNAAPAGEENVVDKGPVSEKDEFSTTEKDTDTDDDREAEDGDEEEI